MDDVIGGSVDCEVGVVVMVAGASSCAEIGVECSEGVASADSGSDSCCAVAADDKSRWIN